MIYTIAVTEIKTNKGVVAFKTRNRDSAVQEFLHQCSTRNSTVYEVWLQRTTEEELAAMENGMADVAKEIPQ